jgi:hypothetical protein
MTLRKWKKTTAGALGIGFLVALGACAEARPIMDDRADGRGGLMSQAAGYELQVLEGGMPAPTFFHGGESYVLGQLGARYTVRVINHTGRRMEAVVSVDGRDVVDGRPADYRNKRGYLVPAWGSVDIDGWRLSRAQVAAFRFSTVPESYAARTGSAREVGVIGAAIFPERYVPRPPPPRPLEVPYPRADSEPPPYTPPSYPRDEAGSVGRSSGGHGEAEASPSASAAPSAPSSPLADKSASESRNRRGLGTEFGEAVGSSVREVAFIRANPSRPTVLLGTRYNDRDGLVALGIDVDPRPPVCNGWSCDDDLELRQTANPFPVTERRYAAPPPCWSGGRVCR